ncbi:MAG TPA: hypothetical protein VHW09_26675 [Bryobacteraceae bacterium]|jgi:hypothetical protein|nr:hypothetical protein [Bryobacteraceae bacterium]
MFEGSANWLSIPLWLPIDVAFAIVCGIIASYNGRKFWPWVGWGVLFGPLTLVYLVVVVVRRGGER